MKAPPTRILPSACTAMAWTGLFAFGLKAVSSVPSVFKPGDVVARHAENAGKIAADENLAVRLNSDGDSNDCATMLRSSVWSSPPSVSKPGDAGCASLSAIRCERGEIAARQNLAVRLHRDCIDITVRVRVERIGQAGRGIEPGDAIARLSTDAVRVEMAARQNLAIRLHRD